jgi:D-3-phosphoglycerate dehydrogenase
MKVIIADQFSAVGMEALTSAGWEVIFDKSLKEGTLMEALANEQPEALVVRSTKVPAELQDANPNLKLVIRAGAGFDNIDFAHAASKGTKVANCPGKNATAVAELAIGLMLCIDR